MTWTKLPDDALDRQPELSVSRSARLLNIEAMLRCNRTLSNGVITRTELPRISDSPDLEADVSELVGAGIWSPVTADSWQVDWTDQEDAAKVRERRKLTADRQRRWRQHASGDHSECDPKRCHVTRDRTRDATRYETPTRTEPFRTGPDRPEGTGQDQGHVPALAGAPPSLATEEASARLGRLPHLWAGDCCPLPETHPIHRSAS